MECVEANVSRSESDCANVRQNITVLEAKLLEWFVDGEVDYLRDWSFEYAHWEAHLNGIKTTDRKYVYLQVVRRSEFMEEAYEKVMKAVNENRGKEIVRMEIGLPTYDEIDGMIRKRMKGKKC